MKTIQIALAAGAALALAGAAQAQAQAKAQDFQPKTAGTVMLNVRLTDVAPDAGDAITTLNGAATGLTAHVGDSIVPTLGLTYFFTDHVAAEVIAGSSKHTVRAKGAGADVKLQETWVLPPTVTLQYHFAPAAKVSPYVGAGVNYMLFYAEKDHNGFGLDIDNGFGLALQAGADVAIHGPWSANVDVKKIFFETDAKDPWNGVKSKVELDPWVVSAGIGYKF